jgi:hypothetical protein
VRAMSIRMVRTRKFGACSAICRHSAACSLHSTDVIIAVPRTNNPRYPDTDEMFRPLDIEGCQPLWRS